jgi:hypothetical protein
MRLAASRTDFATLYWISLMPRFPLSFLIDKEHIQADYKAKGKQGRLFERDSPAATARDGLPAPGYPHRERPALSAVSGKRLIRLGKFAGPPGRLARPLPAGPAGWRRCAPNSMRRWADCPFDESAQDYCSM